MTAQSKTVLYLDTTTSRLMMGLGQGDQLIAECSVPCQSHRYHSALLIPAIRDMLKEAGLSIKDLEALGVNHGPGSFTGIRTGLITVRTMAQFLELPVYVFNQFELLASGSDRPVAVYMDALRGRAYHATLHFDSNGPVYLEPPSLKALSEEEAFDASIADLLVSPTLAERFSSVSPRLLEENLFTPIIMNTLKSHYGEFFRKHWREVIPYYLQEPSITIKKPRPAGP